MDQATENFWKEWAEIGRELLAYGKEINYGMSLVEVKFQAGLPAVIIRSKSVKKKYATSPEARNEIDRVLDKAIEMGEQGALTFTVALNGKGIGQLILDEYGNRLLK